MTEEQTEEEFWNALVEKVKSHIRQKNSGKTYQQFYMKNKTHILVTNETNKRIKALKKRKETMNDFIVRLLNLYDKIKEIEKKKGNKNGRDKLFTE